MPLDLRAARARSRVRLTYLSRFGRFPDLAHPRLFTEWVQWRKLNDRSAHHPLLMDKIAAKARAEKTLGPEWIIPTLWSGRTLPSRPPVSTRAMLKARHGCNQNAVLDMPLAGQAWDRLRDTARQWCARPYGTVLDEWAYSPVPRGLLIEPFVSDTRELPIDYKIHVFGGMATHVQVHVNRGKNHRWMLHDRAFKPLKPTTDPMPAPRSLTAMLAAAEALASREDYLRVDFYEVRGQPLFGEYCLYPGSGLDRFALPGLDKEFGALWSHARQGRPMPAPGWRSAWSEVPA
ncbi:ATP-grasp fold amidoligase family protein [Qipengyuania sediminis]|uniref:ATP-grasp fold amidoligase family protein n=1 Tax=Qipengyuania sediminis TaxID=1532023 RepID=UPI0010598B62|nr:ATP-grasp fold amidoligase family protein [Qipengyuania sediminis]